MYRAFCDIMKGIKFLPYTQKSARPICRGICFAQIIIFFIRHLLVFLNFQYKQLNDIFPVLFEANGSHLDSGCLFFIAFAVISKMHFVLFIVLISLMLSFKIAHFGPESKLDRLPQISS